MIRIYFQDTAAKGIAARNQLIEIATASLSDLMKEHPEHRTEAKQDLQLLNAQKMGEHEAEIEKIKNVFLAILRDIKKDIDNGEQPGEAVNAAMFQAMRDALAEQKQNPLSIDDVSAMVAGQIGQFIPMDEEISEQFQQLAKKMMGADRRYTKRGKTMSDVMTPEQRSRAMSHIKGKDTRIEVLLRKALWHKGIRYRKNYKKLPGTPDIAITKYRIAIFCDSEFFHGYNWEIKKQKLGHNREYWIKKIERNMARDRENDFKLIAMDWVPMHFWGQEIQKRTVECVEAVEDLIFELQMMQFDGMIEDMRDCVEDIK